MIRLVDRKADHYFWSAFFLFILFFTCLKSNSANQSYSLYLNIEKSAKNFSFIRLEKKFKLSNDSACAANDSIALPKYFKLKAVLLAIFLGNFGAHRIYLGTSPIVPVAYCVTLGGFFILPILDAIYILLQPDPKMLLNNNSFLLWNH
ncbi:MAG: hypothetical protein KatS3mg034_1633 [Vicingaceae bacterium]|nr:MAG: hypothetical protein KatS3mg034_1633 [Vicingaceae bacterium]